MDDKKYLKKVSETFGRGPSNAVLENGNPIHNVSSSSIQQPALEESNSDFRDAEVTIIGRVDEEWLATIRQLVIATRIDESQEEHAPPPTRRRSRKHALTFSILTFIALGVSIGFIVSYIILGPGQTGDDQDEIGSNPDSDVLYVPSVAPSPFRKKYHDKPTFTEKYSPELTYLIDQIESFSNVDSIKDEETAQGQAFQWLRDQKSNANDTIVERFSLATVYLSTGWVAYDAKGSNTGGKINLTTLSSQHVCDWKWFLNGKWKGVIDCDIENKTASLDLSSMGLAGYIPPEIGGLSKLLQLDVQQNNLAQSLPSTIGKLESLVFLNGGWNQITGMIPTDIGFLTRLQTLFLKENKLEGKLPSELGLLRSLEEIFLESNNLKGQVPFEMGNLTLLKSIHLECNDFTGNMDDVFGTLPNIQIFYADCASCIFPQKPKEVICDTCTMCCDFQGRCISN